MSVTITDLWCMSATDLAEAIRSRQISSQEVIEAHLRRIEAVNSSVNALGLPAVALPVGIGDGLPQSVQLIGPRYREDLCFDAAAAIEDRVGIITPIDPR
jgi:Asp-tRNA(Asn)/Glu-tRNA(Gln) amidotransferase A subunit family amidase